MRGQFSKEKKKWMERKESTTGGGNVNVQKAAGERSKECVGDGKISMPVAASPYTGVTKEPGQSSHLTQMFI